MLRVGDLIRDHAVMEDARREAAAWCDGMVGSDPLVAYLADVWSTRFGLAGVG
jgi:hypothetical protein